MEIINFVVMKILLLFTSFLLGSNIIFFKINIFNFYIEIFFLQKKSQRTPDVDTKRLTLAFSL